MLCVGTRSDSSLKSNFRERLNCSEYCWTLQKSENHDEFEVMNSHKRFIIHHSSFIIHHLTMHLIKDTCTGCGYCLLVCPYDALRSNGWAEVIHDKCTNCNLCVYACPNDCFVPEPDFPLEPYTPRIKEKYDVVIIGSGIGGLMAGVALARTGHSVAVFEKLGFPGGRYTEIDYKGVAVTTGAWTNLGPKSHIGRFLLDLDIDLEYASLEDAGLTEQYSIRFPNGRQYQNLFALLTPQARKAWLKAILTGRQYLTRPTKEESSNSTNQLPTPNNQSPDLLRAGHFQSLDDITAADYMAEFSDDPDLLAIVDATAATASGLNSTKIPAGEYIQIILDGRQAGREFAMPRGGVRTIINALTKALRQAGGTLFIRSPVAEILISPPAQGRREAIGVMLEDGRTVRSRVVLHNGGPGAFVKLVGAQNLPGEYLDRLAGLKGVECADIFCATREPLFSEAPITMTPKCRRVVGIFSPTVLDPNLSKNGLYLADAFFPTYSDDRTAELDLALADMRDLFPDFDNVVEWAVPMFFTGTWPGTESGQTFGQTGENRLDPVTPIQNCFLVGMDVQGSGVAGDLIPIGVRRVLSYLQKTI
jgi:phytoene dehydrogenase-like protein/NAD-dependent dihydropyrimidine dehydrogenase PreA subunit